MFAEGNVCAWPQEEDEPIWQALWWISTIQVEWPGEIKKYIGQIGAKMMTNMYPICIQYVSDMYLIWYVSNMYLSAVSPVSF